MAESNGQGNGKLEQAMAALIQTQAILVQTQATNQTNYLAQKAETDKEMANLRKKALKLERKMDNRMAEIAQESARIQLQNDERFERIEALLIEHSRMLLAMPDAIRDKIGFKVPAPPATNV